MQRWRDKKVFVCIIKTLDESQATGPAQSAMLKPGNFPNNVRRVMIYAGTWNHVAKKKAGHSSRLTMTGYVNPQLC